MAVDQACDAGEDSCICSQRSICMVKKDMVLGSQEVSNYDEQLA